MKAIILKSIGFYLNVLSVVAPGLAARKGFELFCRPVRTPVKRHHLAFLGTAASFTVPYRRGMVRAYRWGTGGTKILFLHGWQSHTFRWKPFIEELLARDPGAYTIYALDAPGHGLSEGHFLNLPLYADVVSNLLDTTGPLHAIVGHSMGSFATLLLFHQKRVAANRLVLFGTPGEATDFFDFYRQVMKLSKKSERIILDYFVKELGTTPQYYSAPAFARSVEVPGLLIHDESDPEAPYGHAVRIHQNWRNSELITTRGFGHTLKSPALVKQVADYVAEARDMPLEIGMSRANTV